VTDAPGRAPDVRVCFVGDSFVAGVGDPQHLGWAGRLAAHSHHRGPALTSYNLGIRRDTTSDVLGRWRTECSPRLPAGCRAGVVLSFGVNDTSMERGASRVDPGTSAENLDALLRQAGHAGWPVLTAGPPPVDDEEQNERIAVLDAAFAAVCAGSCPTSPCCPPCVRTGCGADRYARATVPTPAPRVTRSSRRYCCRPGGAGSPRSGAESATGAVAAGR